MSIATTTTQHTKPTQRIGLIAGWGRYPVVIAEALRAAGYDVYCLGVYGHANLELRDACDEFQWHGLGRFNAAVRFFRKHRVTDIVMCGKIHKRMLFQANFLFRLLPDLATIRLFASHFIFRSKDCKDDTLMLAVIQFFADRDIHFVPPTDFAPELLVKHGQLTRRGPSKAQWQDIRLGWTIARDLGRLDVGQSVVVRNQTAIAIEAIEGTDQCIRRAGQLCTSGGFTVVKVAKPNQDMRFDVPTVGLGTIQSIQESGGKVLAIESEKTVFIDQEKVIELADKHGIVIVATCDDEVLEGEQIH